MLDLKPVAPGETSALLQALRARNAELEAALQAAGAAAVGPRADDERRPEALDASETAPDLARRDGGRAELREIARELERRVAECESKNARIAELEAALDAVPVGVFIADDPSCARVVGNATARGFLGASIDENLSPRAVNGAPARYRLLRDGVAIPEAEVPMVRAALTGTPVRGIEMTIVRADGTARDVLGNTAPILDAAGEPRGAVAAFLDVTEHRRALEALRESESRLRMVLERIPVLLVALDERGQFIVWNNECERVTGYAAAEMVGNPGALETLHPDPAYRATLVERWARANDNRPDEARMTCKDGSERVVEWTSLEKRIPVPGWARWSIGIDVTDLRGTQATMRRVLQAVEQAEEAIIITDPAGKIEYVNPAVCLLSGYTNTELLGKTPSIFKSGQQDRAFYADLWRTIKSGATWRGLLTNQGKDGASFQEAAVIAPVRDERGEIVNFVAVKRNLARERHLEAQLLQAQKLEAVGQLAGGVAHDFNNALSAVIGYCDLALMEGEQAPLPGHLPDYLAQIRAAGDRASSVARQLLVFSRRQTIDLRVADVNDVVKGLVKMLRRLIGEEIQVETSLATDLVQASADTGQIEQVIINLCLNARDAMVRREGRFRIDGVLQDVQTLPRSVRAPVTSRIKIISRMDITNTRRPQDSRTKLRIDGGEIDLRVSTLPTLYGEKIVLRLLDPKNVGLSLTDLFQPDELSVFESILLRPQGLVLVTGPTGSGKTTTLYAALRRLEERSRNIVTLEDPVEYRLRGVNQVEIREADGLGFAAGLRAILRQDPNVVLVGEIRDAETARIALQAAITGHLVLTSLHTNDAVAAVARLADLGADPTLLAEGLAGTIAQRLVRRLCPHCREPYPATAQEVAQGGPALRGATLYGAKGCEKCDYRGLKGRMAVYEILPMLPEMKSLLTVRGAEQAIRRACRVAGVGSMFDAGLRHALAGRTTLREVLRVVPRDPIESALRCSCCGAVLDRELRACTACGAPVSTVCPGCRKDVLASWHFCGACGRPLGDRRSSMSSAALPPERDSAPSPKTGASAALIVRADEDEAARGPAPASSLLIERERPVARPIPASAAA